MGLPELIISRDLAGQRYAAAVAELHDALVDLAAIDQALMNANLGYDGRNDVRGFHDLPAESQSSSIGPCSVCNCGRG